jgi:hypothetical protein
MSFWGLTVWAVMGLLGLVLQTVLLFKDHLAAYQPELKPLLVTACQNLGCQIRSLQKTEAVVIDHAAVNLVPLDHPLDEMVLQAPQWVLQINLRNAGAVTVATPWIELTLTDVQDKAVVRKVFNPQVWGASSVIEPGEIMAHELLLSVKPESANFMGYRMLAFYP